LFLANINTKTAGPLKARDP